MREEDEEREGRGVQRQCSAVDGHGLAWHGRRQGHYGHFRETPCDPREVIKARK